MFVQSCVPASSPSSCTTAAVATSLPRREPDARDSRNEDKTSRFWEQPEWVCRTFACVSSSSHLCTTSYLLQPTCDVKSCFCCSGSMATIHANVTRQTKEGNQAVSNTPQQHTLSSKHALFPIHSRKTKRTACGAAGSYQDTGWQHWCNLCARCTTWEEKCWQTRIMLAQKSSTRFNR